MNKFLTCAFEIKAVGDNGRVEGYASAFDNIDQGDDLIRRGAFAKTLQESGGKVPILSNHDYKLQIGWNMKATETDRGLFVEGDFLIKEIEKAKEHYALIQKALAIGAKAGFSFGYAPVKFETSRDTGVRTLTELKLFEWSPVTFPMNTSAFATAAKSWAKPVVSCEESLDQFIFLMKENGYTEAVIMQALAHTQEMHAKKNPDADAQFIRELDKIQSILKTNH